jgi:large subunit ribosomal protein L22
VESKAILRYARISPRKVRRVTDLIKGKNAGDAMINLGFLPHRGSDLVAKVLKSAMANAEQKKVADPESMSPTMKRMRPRAQGRADVIRKRTSHITLVLQD